MILVTGGAGYIGSHMVKALLNEGRDVVVLDNLSTGYRDLVGGGTFVEGDINDASTLDEIFTRFPIQVVMHFAAFSQVGESSENPLKYHQNNIGGTITLLTRMLSHNVLRFVFSSSAAVYGSPPTQPIGELSPRAPTSPYGFTKMCMEQILSDCALAHGLRHCSLRYFNAAGADESATIGERHDPETHLIPLILKVAAGKRDAITIFGTDYPTPDGTCIRDYVHVSDLADAHLRVLEGLERDDLPTVFNVGTNVGFSVREVIDSVERVTARPIQRILGVRRPGDPPELVADATLLAETLGWQPCYRDLDDIVATAWAWERRSDHMKSS